LGNLAFLRGTLMLWITGGEIHQPVNFPSSMLKAMAASLYIVVEGEDPGFDIFVNGHALARNEDALERLAESLHTAPLLQFFSADENSMCLLLEQGAGDPEWATHLPEPQWFDPSDGLSTVRMLIRYLIDTPVCFGSETLPVLNELREYERVLEKARLYKLRWHLAVSWR
jgi:hypothetical protein